MTEQIIKARKLRAVNLPDNNVGRQRQTLYKHAVIRIKDAQEKGFHLEAIAIIESLISDRLESRLSQLYGNTQEFQILGWLINKMRSKETDPALRDIVLNDLNTWKDDRNRSLHQMAKLGADSNKS